MELWQGPLKFVKVLMEGGMVRSKQEARVDIWQDLCWTLCVCECMYQIRSTISIPFQSSLGRILADWSTSSYKPMNEKKMILMVTPPALCICIR